MSERTFGVEVEFGTYMYEEDVENRLNRAFPGYSSWWGAYPDGTSIEIHTPPLKGEEGHEFLGNIFDVLINKCDGYVTSEDGMHVHFGAGDYAEKPAILARAVRSWINLEEVLNRFIIPYRRGAYWACGDFNNTVERKALPSELRKLKKDKTGKQDYYGTPNRRLYPGRRKLNIDHVVAAAQYEGGGYKELDVPTIEVRSHEGTLNIAEASAWIKMLTAFFDYHVARPSLPTLRRPETLLQHLGVDDVTGATLLAKVEKFDKGEYSYADYDEMDQPDDYDDGYY